MDVIEVGQAQEDVATEGFQPAARIVGVVGQQLATDAVGPDRGLALGVRVLTLGAHAADQGDIGGRCDQGVGQARRVGGRVLAVAVQGDDDGRARRQDAGAHGAALSRIGRVRQHPQGRQFRHRRLQFGQGRIAAGVVDEDHLIGPTGEGLGDLARQGHGRAGFVMHRHDDGDFRGGSEAVGHRRSVAHRRARGKPGRAKRLQAEASGERRRRDTTAP
ncbi:hypothetical protein D3C80_1467680 [compost metagenome]